MQTLQTIAGDEPDRLIRRLRRNAAWGLLAMTLLVAVLERSWGPVLGVVLSGSLMIVNFQLLEGVVSRAIAATAENRPPGAGSVAFLAFRLVLLALLLCGIVLVPGITPISVALGLSVLVLAVLIEAFIQLLAGGQTRA